MKIITICNQLRVALKHSALAIAVGAAVTFGAGPSAHATLTYTFADLGGAPAANMEGWTSVFPGNGEIWADYTGYWGGGTPVDGGHLGDGWDAMETQLAHSPAFKLDGSGDLTCQMFGTASPAATPVTAAGVATTHSAAISGTANAGGGFMGVALRDVLTDTYVLWSAWPGSDFAPAAFADIGFTAAQLAPFANDGRTYTLDFIDNDKAPVADDHWVTLGGATIPGALAVLRADCDILTFSPGGVIDQGAKTITLSVPSATNLATFAPTFTMSAGASCVPASGTAPGFVNMVAKTYKVTAENGIAFKDYSVTVNLAVPTGIIHVSYESGSIPAASTLTGPAGGSGQTWNQPTTATGSGLLDSAGEPTTVGWSQTNMGGINNWGTPALKMLTSGMSNFARDANFNSQQFVINGLTPGAYYDVWIASQQPNAEKAKGVWSTPNKPITGSRAIDATVNQNTSSWEAGNNYVYFAYVQVNGSGEIVFNGLSAPYYRLPVNGFQLVPTTAPATDYVDWASAYLPTDVSVSTADTDGDGLTNQQEYAFGLNPTSGSSVNPITVQLDQATGMFSYTRRPTPEITGLTYTVLTSTDLVTWTPDAGAVAESVVTAGAVQTVTFTVSNPAVNGQLFVRVKASQ